jgi:hypothetical protein
MSAYNAITLMRFFPFLANNYGGVRQWTIRENLYRQVQSEKPPDGDVSITPDLDDVIVSGRDEFEDSFDFTFDFD